MGIVVIAIFGLMVFLVSTGGTVAALLLEHREEAQRSNEEDRPLATVTDLAAVAQQRSS